MMHDLVSASYVATQYADSSNLDARAQLHIRFGTNPYPWFRWYFERLSLPPEARVLEVGCGPGSLWLENADRIPAGWDITLSDLSPGMLDEAKRRLSAVDHPFNLQGIDAQAIPYPAGSFDAAVANHMLFHVPNRIQALSEIRRVLREGGRFYAATNGEANMRELQELLHEIDETVPGRRDVQFTLENGRQQLETHFAHVKRHDYADSLAVTEVEPLVAYLLSTRATIDRNDPRLRAFEERIRHEIETAGAFTITKSVGLFETW
jgi:ubiquinone/menaquinone biosynthesis C-methylase UbiE